MNFYTLASDVYDMLEITYFRNPGKNPRSIINAILYGDNIKVLDMCCGTLANTIPAAKTHNTALFLGIDLSKQMLKKARKKVRRNHLDNVRLKYADATNSHIKKESLDYIVLGLALHEMEPPLQEKILQEAYRILKSDGRLIVLEWEKPQNILQKLLFFPLLIAEQLLNRSFLAFYLCDKEQFFHKNNFEICNIVHCSYSAVLECRKKILN